MPQCYCRQGDGACRVITTPENNGDEPAKGVVLTASVGTGGANRKHDVQALQQGFNDLDKKDGQPNPLLVVDGICGPKTLGVIRKFQTEQCGFKWPDARVDPNKQTHNRLNELLGGGGVAPMAKKGNGTAGDDEFKNPYTKPYVLSLIPDALLCVKAARRRLDLAWPVIDKPPKDWNAATMGKERADAVALLKLHFHIHKLANRQHVVNQLIHLYRTMEQVFIRPGNLWGEYTFDDDPYPQDHTQDAMYTFAGGYFLQGQFNPRPRRQRLDTIYFCRLLDGMPHENCVLALVHELAHFCGSTVPGRTVDDFGSYGWVTSARMRWLPATLRIRHAESIANFAFDSLPGDTMPPTPSGT
jgi:hypothetical protein